MLKLSGLIFVSLLMASPANASITDQGSLEPAKAPKASAPVSVTEVTEGYMPLAQRFSFGIGSGINSFTGNIGKLYDKSGPVLDLRGEWAFHPTWSLRVGGDLAKYSFNAAPTGAVDVDTKSLQISSQSHFLSTAMVNDGLDPYLSLGGQWLTRTQKFHNYSSVEKDNAIGFGLGLGTNFFMASGHLSFWMEAAVNQIFFADRNDSQYLESGISDMTGQMLSGRLGMKYLF